MDKNRQTDLINYLLLATEDQYNYFNNIKALAENILKAKKEYLKDPTQEKLIRALAQFAPPKNIFKINIEDYSFTIKNNPKIVDYIFRYIRALETALNLAQIYNNDIVILLQQNLSQQDYINQIKLQIDHNYSKIIFAINMSIFILAKLLEEAHSYSKFLGKRNKIIRYIDINNYAGYIDLIAKDITQHLGNDLWLRPFQDVKIKNINKVKTFFNCLNVVYGIWKHRKKENYILAPIEKTLELMHYKDSKLLAELSIYMTRGLEFMHDFGIITDDSKAGYFVRSDNGGAKIILGREFEPSIYRGQNYDYEKFIPSFQREKLVADVVKHCVEYVKREEFKQYFTLTPYFQILSGLNIMGRYFEFDLDAIAQHYEFGTNYIDVTKDIKTALFFAYTECANGKYFPVTDFEKYHPTLYVANFSMLLQENNPLIPVGFQAVLRPQKQTAMAIAINNTEDNPINKFTKIDLPRRPEIAYGIFNSFNGGKDLFPDEPMKVIEQQIRERNILNKEIFEEYCKKFNKDEAELKRLITPYYKIESSMLPVDSELFVKMKDEVYNDLIPWIKENIFYRKVQYPSDKNPQFYLSLFPQYLNGTIYKYE